MKRAVSLWPEKVPRLFHVKCSCRLPLLSRAGADEVSEHVFAELCVDFLGPEAGSAVDTESWHEQFQKRRGAGSRFLSDINDNIALSVAAVVLSPLSRIVNGLMGDTREGVRKAPEVVQFAAHVKRCSEVAQQVGEILLTHLHTGIWDTVLPVRYDNLAINEEVCRSVSLDWCPAKPGTSLN